MSQRKGKVNAMAMFRKLRIFAQLSRLFACPNSGFSHHFSETNPTFCFAAACRPPLMKMLGFSD